MYQMSSKIEIPITTLSDGTAILIVVPQNSITGAFTTNFAAYPFASVANGSTQNPFAATPIYAPAGPFNSQLANMANYGVDVCSVDFIQT